MKKNFKDISLKYKLITCFLIIIIINGVVGVINLKFMKDISEMVNTTYDRSLMSGTFSQAAKFNFSQFDLEIRSALLARDNDAYDLHKAKSEKYYETLLSDIEVVKERTLSDRADSILSDINNQLNETQKIKDELLLKKEDLLKEKIRNKNSLALISSWNEIKLKKNLYKDLTRLHDDSAEQGYIYRLASEEKNKKSFNLSIAILVACLSISILLSFLISYLIIKPIFKLKDVCEKVEQGDFMTRTAINSKDELGMLAHSLNFMLDTIDDRNKNISSLLSSLPFGLFYFDKKGLISKERSQTTDLIFKNFESYENLTDFYGDHGCNTKQVSDVLKATFSGMIPFDSAVYLFPDTIFHNNGTEIRTIHLSFKPKFGEKKKLERVIMLAEDITDKIRALKESKELTERVERISKVSADIESFKEFIPAVKTFLKDSKNRLTHFKAEIENDLKRDLHSLKGLLGVYSFTTCAEEIHSLETLIGIDIQAKIPEAIAYINKAEKLFFAQSADIERLLALSKDEGYKYFDIEKINKLKKIIQQSSKAELIEAFKDLDKYPIQKAFAKYVNYAESIAKKMEGKSIRLIFDPSDEITQTEAKILDTAVLHILNNSIDHGIESSDTRHNLNKPNSGEIKFSFKRDEASGIQLKISDDGKGIDGDLLVQKAIEGGYLSQEEAALKTEEEKISLIFASGLSTKDETSTLSGRGVGMDAVKNYIESLGGTIHLTSKTGSGTTFELNIPQESFSAI